MKVYGFCRELKPTNARRCELMPSGIVAERIYYRMSHAFTIFALGDA